MPAFAAKPLGAEIDATAPDGTAVRLLLALEGGSLAHFELAAGAVSQAVVHRTVEEIWYVLSGDGEIWRAMGDQVEMTPLRAGLALTIPLGTAFQFRAGLSEPLRFLAITMPPWPGMDEAYTIEGPWPPSAVVTPRGLG